MSRYRETSCEICDDFHERSFHIFSWISREIRRIYTEICDGFHGFRQKYICGRIPMDVHKWINPRKIVALLLGFVLRLLQT